MTNTILSPTEAVAKIKATKGGFFRVMFIKRTTGELRDMICRTGVTKHLRGGEPAYNFAEKNLLSVYDMEREGYRCIPLDAILAIRVDGEIFQVAKD